MVIVVGMPDDMVVEVVEAGSLSHSPVPGMLDNGIPAYPPQERLVVQVNRLPNSELRKRVTGHRPESSYTCLWCLRQTETLHAQSPKEEMLLREQEMRDAKREKHVDDTLVPEALQHRAAVRRIRSLSMGSAG